MDLATPTATKIVGALSMAVIAGLGWTLVVGPETSTLSETREEITAARDQNTALAAQLAVLERQRDDLATTRRTARELAELFPPTADQPGLFEAVTAAAVDSGIGAKGVTALTPTPPVIGAPPGDGATAPVPPPATDPGDPAAAAGGGLAWQSVTVSVAGTYDQTQRLLENLEHMSRAYLIRSVSLSGDPATGDYSTTITGAMFVLPPVTDPGKTLNLSGTTQAEG